jgi:tryptophan synthase alpha chain
LVAGDFVPKQRLVPPDHQSPISNHQSSDSRIASAFARAREEKRAAFIPFLTAGDPTPGATIDLARTLAACGADVLELGVPFSDPIADGPVLQRSAGRALAGGTTVEAVLGMARQIRAQTDLALVLFSYLNPLLRRGLARVAEEARDAGVDGVLVTDLPPEEAGPIQPLLRSASLDTIFLVSPTSPKERMTSAAKLSSGFLYVVSRAGTTGARRALPPDLATTVRRARRAAGGLPVAIGFGISTPAAARAAARLADGVVVGSALVRAAEEAGDRRESAVGELARSLVAGCRRS